MKPAVQIEGLWKKYLLAKERHFTMRDALTAIFSRRRQIEDFWVLEDVNITVQEGEAVGIVGSNGAGKSTLLKLITGIIRPTRGSVTTNGFVSGFLDLQAGFHPDLTGRENVFLYGSMLGLLRKQIAGRFDSIIDFSELADFVDTPVKYYSSGMQMRLGFSVAVHVDPEIILVDEVLAVGDYSFQQKCLKRIGRMQREGVTILFVSHDFAAVERLCSRAVWLEQGRVQADGDTAAVLTRMRRRYGWEGNDNGIGTGRRLLG